MKTHSLISRISTIWMTIRNKSETTPNSQNIQLNTLLVITGPTASGKTDISVEIAMRYGCDIISADSRQFYKGLRIGTAAPSPDQLSKVKHHFVGFLPVTSYYSASIYEQEVIKLLPSLFENSRVAILTGGSGLYIDAVCNGIDNIPDVDPDIRNHYNEKFEKEGVEALRNELRIVDPEQYHRVDLRNPRRIMRALEIFATTGQPYSSFLNRDKIDRDFRIIKIGLMPRRDLLYDSINRRVDNMITGGLVEEARSFFRYRSCNALQTVGYRELFRSFDGEITLAEAIDLIKRNTRRYARRQITWWTRDKEIRWFSPGEVEAISEYIGEKTG
jgi:tRNA dimethylallyltransferase